MFLLELVLQGVRGIRELQRLRFQTGFNLVSARNESGKTTAVDAVERLLFPSDRDGRLEPLVSRQAPDASRAALVVLADDKVYYRVIEDFSRRGVNLSKYNGQTKDFTLVYKEWDQAAQFMAQQTAGMSEGDYGRLFIFRREHFACSPTRPAAPSPSFAPPAPRPQQRSGPTPAQEARLAELREMLRKAEDAGDASYKLDSAKIRLGEVMKRLEALEEINGKMADIRTNLAPLKGCDALPENLGDIIREHELSQQQKMARSDELQQDIEGLRLQLHSMPRASLWTDVLFILGVVAGIASLVAGLGVLSAEQADYFLIGIVVAIGLIAAGWYRSSRKNAQLKAVEREMERLVAELDEVEKSFEDGGAEIVVCMRATESKTSDELREKAENYRYFRAQLNEIEEEWKRLLGGITPEALYAEYQKQQQEVIEAERAARALAEHAVDTYSIRQEIERIESETSPSLSWGEDPSGGGFLGADVLAPSPSAGPAVFDAELAIASRAAGIEMETLVPAVEAAAQRNFQTVTGGAYVKVEAGHGTDPVVHAGDHSAVGYADLSHSTKELLYFCLRAGLIEALAGKLKLPFVLDDVLAGFDQNRQRAACQILRTLGTKTQVVLFSSNPSLRAEGDTAAELK